MCRRARALRTLLCLALGLSLLGGCTGLLSYDDDDLPEEAGRANDGEDGRSDPLPPDDSGGGDVTPVDLGPVDTGGGDHDVADSADEADRDPARDTSNDPDPVPDVPSDRDLNPEPDGPEDAVEEEVVWGCADHNARVVSVSIPSSIQAGDHATGSVTVANNGRSTWTEAGGFRLGSPGDGDPFVEPARLFLPPGVSVAGDPDNPPSYTFVFGMDAPFEGGSYVTDWQMLQEGECWFGEVATRTVTVAGNVEPGVCGTPLPPWENERSRIKLHCGGAWCDATPTCHGCDFCATIGLGCLPGTGPEPPCTPRCDCPVRPDGHPERGPCEVYYLGGRPFWRSDGEVFLHPDNDFLANCNDCTWIEVCWADGTRCTRVNF